MMKRSSNIHFGTPCWLIAVKNRKLYILRVGPSFIMCRTPRKDKVKVVSISKSFFFLKGRDKLI